MLLPGFLATISILLTSEVIVEDHAPSVVVEERKPEVVIEPPVAEYRVYPHHHHYHDEVVEEEVIR